MGSEDQNEIMIRTGFLKHVNQKRKNLMNCVPQSAIRNIWWHPFCDGSKKKLVAKASGVAKSQSTAQKSK